MSNKVEFVLKVNKDAKTSCDIIVGEDALHLTENEISSLVTQIGDIRPDLIENTQPLKDKQEEIESLEEEIRQLEEDATNLEEEILEIKTSSIGGGK